MKKRQTYTLEQETIDLLKKTSEETMIPQARIVEEAIKEMCKKLSSK
ncbi:ribbon-helix-helix domain-containing protein [Cytobacillus oceanisediminis]|nr:MULTISPECIES: ribbon-helix-helix domain-containing protein [Bacillaceae]MBZ9536293.1 ribbon-helix-helix domain-containing protein [Cytobacillus oceanisediminis]